MKCVICGIEINFIEESTDQGWIPYFYDAEIECGPACPECSGTLIQMGKDGEMELKEQYEGKIEYKENYLYKPSEEECLIGAMPVYMPIHRYLKQGGYPVTEKIWKSSLSIPIYPSLKDEEISRVTHEVSNLLGNQPMKIRLDLGISPKIYPVGLFLTLLLLVPSIRFFFVSAGYRWAYILGLSFGICFSIIPLLRLIAIKWGILDEPDRRKVHGSPTPLFGGGGVFIAFVLGILINGIHSVELIVILFASAMIFIVSVVDDIREIPASIKLLIQLLSAGLVISFGITVSVIPLSFGLIGKAGNIALTIMWIVGITNAMNFLDGMDGAAAGVGAIISFFLGVLAFLTDQPFLGWISLSMMGSCLGFLPYNLKMKERASIFLGDAGSTFIGFVLATLAVYGHWWEGDNNPIVSFASPLLIFWILIADMTYITATPDFEKKGLEFQGMDRICGKGSPPASLIPCLGRQRKSVFFIYAFAVTLGISALVLRHADTLNAALLLVQAVFIVILGGILERHLRRLSKNNNMNSDK